MLTGVFGTQPSAQVLWAFSDRTGGASEGPYASRNLGLHVGDDASVVKANRAGVAAELGLAADALVFMEQTHGDTVTVVDAPQAEQIGDCDGLVTGSAGIGLAVMVADCVPVLLADPEAGVLAAVHAGRRGVENGIAARAVDVMERLGAHRGGIAARLGPAVCGACYEVPAELSDAVLRVAPEAAARTPAGTPGLDLRRGLVGVLRQLGLRDVETIGPCTRETPELFSYRAADGAPTGRFAGFVWRTAAGS
jgi:YfiH family protein